MRLPNHAALGNGAMTSLSHVERLARAVPKPRCYAVLQSTPCVGR